MVTVSIFGLYRQYEMCATFKSLRLSHTLLEIRHWVLTDLRIFRPAVNSSLIAADNSVLKSQIQAALGGFADGGLCGVFCFSQDGQDLQRFTLHQFLRKTFVSLHEVHCDYHTTMPQVQTFA